MIRRATRPQPNRPPPSSSSSSSKSFSSSVREWPKIRSARRAPFELVGWLRFCGQEQDRFVNAKGLADGSQPQNYRNAAKPGRGAVPRPRDGSPPGIGRCQAFRTSVTFFQSLMDKRPRHPSTFSKPHHWFAPSRGRGRRKILAKNISLNDPNMHESRRVGNKPLNMLTCWTRLGSVSERLARGATCYRTRRIRFG